MHVLSFKVLSFKVLSARGEDPLSIDLNLYTNFVNHVLMNVRWQQKSRQASGQNGWEAVILLFLITDIKMDISF